MNEANASAVDPKPLLTVRIYPDATSTVEEGDMAALPEWFACRIRERVQNLSEL